jgi:excinuclease UvrABC nuclease subunit
MKKKIFEELSRDYRKICKAKKIIITEELINNLPNNPGVYIFYEDTKARYVGRANNLRKRLKNHLSSSKTGSNSSFRRKIYNKNKIKYFQNTKKYIMKNMKLYYLEFDKNDVAYAYTLLLEAFLIRLWKSRKKHKLVNCDYDLGKEKLK